MKAPNPQHIILSVNTLWEDATRLLLKYDRLIKDDTEPTSSLMIKSIGMIDDEITQRNPQSMLPNTGSMLDK